MHVVICSYIIYLAVYTERTLRNPAPLSVACQSHVRVLISAVG